MNAAPLGDTKGERGAPPPLPAAAGTDRAPAGSGRVGDYKGEGEGRAPPVPPPVTPAARATTSAGLDAGEHGLDGPGAGPAAEEARDTLWVNVGGQSFALDRAWLERHHANFVSALDGQSGRFHVRRRRHPEGHDELMIEGDGESFRRIKLWLQGNVAFLRALPKEELLILRGEADRLGFELLVADLNWHLADARAGSPIVDPALLDLSAETLTTPAFWGRRALGGLHPLLDSALEAFAALAEEQKLGDSRPLVRSLLKEWLCFPCVAAAFRAPTPPSVRQRAEQTTLSAQLEELHRLVCAVCDERKAPRPSLAEGQRILREELATELWVPEPWMPLSPQVLAGMVKGDRAFPHVTEPFLGWIGAASGDLKDADASVRAMEASEVSEAVFRAIVHKWIWTARETGKRARARAAEWEMPPAQERSLPLTLQWLGKFAASAATRPASAAARPQPEPAVQPAPPAAMRPQPQPVVQPAPDRRLAALLPPLLPPSLGPLFSLPRAAAPAGPSAARSPLAGAGMAGAASAGPPLAPAGPSAGGAAASADAGRAAPERQAVSLTSRGMPADAASPTHTLAWGASEGGGSAGAPFCEEKAESLAEADSTGILSGLGFFGTRLRGFFTSVLAPNRSDPLDGAAAGPQPEAEAD
jgi:hypothetical protein